MAGEAIPNPFGIIILILRTSAGVSASARCRAKGQSWPLTWRERSAQESLDRREEPRGVLEPEGVPRVRVQEQVRAGYAAREQLVILHRG
jgi:hypothetical protein